jgi:hypothetical protein
MKSRIITKTTNCRSEFNRAYKHYLEKKGLIQCSYCGYHKHENSKYNDSYGGWVDDKKFRYPSWKLVSKNKWQWMSKNLKIIEESRIIWRGRTYVTVEF